MQIATKYRHRDLADRWLPPTFRYQPLESAQLIR